MCGKLKEKSFTLDFGFKDFSSWLVGSVVSELVCDEAEHPSGRAKFLTPWWPESRV